MKTLVVLSALVAATIAAPTLSEFGLEPNKISESEEKLILEKREKKSIDATENTPDPSLHDQGHHEQSETSPRTLLKKPIIIKKTKGHHHLYRDSEEEKADAESGENCRKEVKVKICDSTSVDENRDDEMLSDSDMHHSIKTAKEAVEHLQKDLLKLEHWNVKSGKTEKEHYDSEKDVEMHHDIEQARQALEHFQKSFETLDKIHSSSSMLKDAEDLEDAQRQLAEIESETQRLVKWKNTIDNIQKNTEKAQNIEPSFKSSQLNMHESANLMNLKEAKTEAKQVETAEKEMAMSASELNEVRIIAPNEVKMRSDAVMLDKASKSNSEKKSAEQSSKDKNAADVKKKDAEEFEDMTFMKSSQKNDHMTNTLSELKKTEEDKTRSTMEEKEQDKPLMVNQKTDNEKNKDISTMAGKEQENQLMDTQKTAWQESSKAKSTMESKDQDKKPFDMHKAAWHETDKRNALSMLSNENQDKVKQESVLSVNSDLSMKSAKEINHNLDVQKINKLEKEANSHIVLKSAEENQHIEKEKQAKEVNNTLKEPEHIDLALDSSNIKEHVLAAPIEKTTLKEAAAVKAASLNQDQTMRMDMIPKSDVASPSQINAAHSLEKNNLVHEKAANTGLAETTNFQMRDSTSNSLLDHNAKWKQDNNQMASRGAYGLGGGYGAASAGAGSIIGASSSGSGAVGVFPNAKVGGCAIPLLLSCSPSVVSGSLAHSGGYSAPAAYRAGDNMKFHKKRDVKKEKKQVTKINRTATRIIEKIPYSYDQQF